MLSCCTGPLSKMMVTVVLVMSLEESSVECISSKLCFAWSTVLLAELRDTWEGVRSAIIELGAQDGLGGDALGVLVVE